MIHFCINNSRHMLEHIEFNPDTYVCIECEQMYELQNGVLVAIEYRLSHGKDPFFVAQDNREQREQDRRQREMWRNDTSIRRLHALNGR